MEQVTGRLWNLFEWTGPTYESNVLMKFFYSCYKIKVKGGPMMEAVVGDMKKKTIKRSCNDDIMMVRHFEKGCRTT